MGLTDSFRNVPTWGWAVGGVLILGLLLLTSRGGGQKATSPEIPATDINDILAQLQDAANTLGKGSNTQQPPPSGTPTKTIAGYFATITGKTPTYDSKGKLLGYISGLRVKTADRIKIGGKWFYKITEGKYAGRYLATSSTISYTPFYTSTPTSTTTSTSTVQNSNNQVS